MYRTNPYPANKFWTHICFPFFWVPRPEHVQHSLQLQELRCGGSSRWCQLPVQLGFEWPTQIGIFNPLPSCLDSCHQVVATQIFLEFSPPTCFFLNFHPIWRAYFSNGLKPLTRNALKVPKEGTFGISWGFCELRMLNGIVKFSLLLLSRPRHPMLLMPCPADRSDQISQISTNLVKFETNSVDVISQPMILGERANLEKTGNDVFLGHFPTLYFWSKKKKIPKITHGN